MIIERDKNYTVYVTLAIFVCVSLLFLYIFACHLSPYLAILINTPVLLVWILYLISTGRTFIMDEKGCTVKIGKYHKTYTWDELKTKRIEKHPFPSMSRGRFAYPYLNRAIFAPYHIRKPKAMHANFYSLFHPLSCIYIQFPIKGNNRSLGRYYEVGEDEFLEKMAAWNVALEHT